MPSHIRENKSDTFLQGSVHWRQIGDFKDFSKIIEGLLEASDLPSDPRARIFLKPNLNNDLTALTGNSTDLRLIGGTAACLREMGYGNIVVGDGPNLGVFRSGADVPARLGLSRLCQRLELPFLDFNRAPGREITLSSGVKAFIPREILEADYIINLPTIKTHAEAVFSCCLKNILGLNIGEYKRKMHWDLPGSILALNKAVPVDFNLVDGLMIMEGDGPGNGDPRRLDWLLAGKDPVIMDAVVCRLIGLDPGAVPYLDLARKRDWSGKPDIWAELDRIEAKVRVKPASRPSLAARILTHHSLGKFRDAIRPLFDNKLVRPWLHKLKLTQDIYESEEAGLTYRVDSGLDCGSCRLCREFCPLELPMAKMFDSRDCLNCGYCFWVCPTGRISVSGETGYWERHRSRYKKRVEKAAARGDNCT